LPLPQPAASTVNSPAQATSACRDRGGPEGVGRITRRHVIRRQLAIPLAAGQEIPGCRRIDDCPGDGRWTARYREGFAPGPSLSAANRAAVGAL
jgi:hypothetical protein